MNRKQSIENDPRLKRNYENQAKKKKEKQEEQKRIDSVGSAFSSVNKEVSKTVVNVGKQGASKGYKQYKENQSKATAQTSKHTTTGTSSKAEDSKLTRRQNAINNDLKLKRNEENRLSGKSIQDNLKALKEETQKNIQTANSNDKKLQDRPKAQRPSDELVNARIAQKNGNATKEQRELLKNQSKASKVMTNLTEGAIKQSVGGTLKAIGDTTTEAEQYRLNLEQNLTDGKITKKQYEKNWNDYKKANPEKYKKWEQWKAKQDDGSGRRLYNYGAEVEESGTKQITDQTEKMSRFGRLAAGAYTSGIGMIGDQLLGPAWAVSMFTRTYGSSLGQAQAEGATKLEDVRNAFGQGAVEVASEYMFGGIGLAKRLPGAGKLAEKLGQGVRKSLNVGFDNLTSKISNNVLRNLAYSGGKLLAGSSEEAAEELVAGILEPMVSGVAYTKNVDARNKSSFEDAIASGSQDVNRKIDNFSAKYGIPRDQVAQMYAESVSDPDYVDGLAQSYAESGFDDKTANKMAQTMQKYMQASISGDSETAEKYKNELSSLYSKKTSVEKKFSVSETAEAMASAALMVAATGGAGSVRTNIVGADLKRTMGKDALTKMVADVDDPVMSARVQAMKESNKDLSNEQAFELFNAYQEQMETDHKATVTASETGLKLSLKNKDYAAPAFLVDSNHEVVSNGELTEQRLSEMRREAQAQIDSFEKVYGKTNLTTEEKLDIVESIAKVQIGAVDEVAMNTLTLSHPEARTVYQELTGETLPATNAETRQYLIQKSISNYQDTAMLETAHKANVDKGAYDRRIVNTLGANGQAVYQQLSDKVGVFDSDGTSRGYVNYIHTLNSAYEAGMNNVSIDTVKTIAINNGINVGDVVEMYYAGKSDAENGFTGGKLVSNEIELTAEQRNFFSDLGRMFNINIELKQMAKGFNGQYDPATNTLTLNTSVDVSRQISYTAMHEITHVLKNIDSNAYDEFAELFKQRYKERNSEDFDAQVKRLVDSYIKAQEDYVARGGKIEKLLSEMSREEQEDYVVEEMICDSMGELLHDEKFIEEICKNENLAQKILTAIQNVLRKLRDLLALSPDYVSVAGMETLEQLDLLKDAEQFFINGMAKAQAQRTQEILDENSGIKHSYIDDLFDELLLDDFEEVTNMAQIIDVNSKEDLLDLTIDDIRDCIKNQDYQTLEEIGQVLYTQDEISELKEEAKEWDEDSWAAVADFEEKFNDFKDYEEPKIRRQINRPESRQHENNGKQVAYTESRIDRLISTSDLGYGESKSSGYISSIHPRDFLKLTLPDTAGEYGVNTFENWERNVGNNVAGQDVRTLDAEELRNNPETPRLEVDMEHNYVVGHEGRHRMRAMLEAGYTSVPVVVRAFDADGHLIKDVTDKVDSLEISSQSFNGGSPVNDNYTTTVSNLIPAAPKFRQDIMDAYGTENADMRFSVVEGEGLKVQIRNNLDVLNQMDIVGTANVESFKSLNDSKKTQKVIEAFKQFGFKIDRKGYGIIEIRENEIKQALKYLKVDSELCAFMLVPKVLKRGVKIDEHIKHKNRGYNTVTFAGPVILNGVRGNLAVAVKETGKKHYKMHRILAPNGKAFEFVDIKKEEVKNRGLSTNNNRQGPPIASSINRIEDSLDSVKLFSIDADYQAAYESNDLETAQRLVDEAAKRAGYDTVVFHGTEAGDINEFEANEFITERNGVSRIKGYFSTNEDYSKNYGTTKKYYINKSNFFAFPETAHKFEEWPSVLEKLGIKGVKLDSSIARDTLKGYVEDDGTRLYSLYELIDISDGQWDGDGNLTEKIQDAGYEGIYWHEGFEEEDIAYMPFNKSAVKSADPFTFDNNGKLIPLSERFNSENNDVRWSIVTDPNSVIDDVEDKDVTLTEGGSAVRFSYNSWADTDKDELKDSLRNAGYSESEIDAWINDVNSVSAIIGSDMLRLNYEADESQDALKDNSEYYYTLDLSTLCQKRRLYQGTYNAIMHILKNYVLAPEDTIALRKMMDEMGYQVPCGICYEESRKKNEGIFAKRWLNGHGVRWKGYKNVEHEDPYIPTLDEVTTTDGRKKLSEEHPEALESYLKYQRTRGSANPKVSFTHTDYRGDIMKLSKSAIEKVKHIGGLRIQSFSDFEIPHVIDMMQAVMDMAAQNLTAQAYTKVPAFADIFGGTGIKINLSLIGKVNPETGELEFDSKEGMDPEEAFRIRNKYSENVGTILVGANKESILKAWADPRIDMVIPFHRSGWKLKEFQELGLGDYADFQKWQSERFLDGSRNGKALSRVKDEDGNKLSGIYSEDYWDDTKTGKENAEAYLKLCAEKKFRPVFANFLVNNGDGTYSLQPDGSTDGYWKSLIDFKMYDNNGVGVPQQEVKPNFDMDVAREVMDSYEGGADTLPVAEDVVEKFVEDYKRKHPSVKFSVDSEGRELTPKQDMFFADSKVRDENGNLLVMHHGTTADFTVFDLGFGGKNGTAEGMGFYFASEKSISDSYGDRVLNVYLNIKKPLVKGEKSLTLNDAYNLVKESAYREANEIIEDYDGDFAAALKDTWVSNYEYTYGSDGIETVFRSVAKTLLDNNEDDYDLISEMRIANGVHNYNSFADYVSMITEITGYDGYVSETELANGSPSYVVIAWYPEQIKSVDNESPTNDIDIRFSVDNEGNELSREQSEFFMNSKARADDGRLKVLYHGTNRGGFTIFDADESEGMFFFAGSNYLAETYIGDDYDVEELNKDRLNDISDETPGMYKVYLNLQNPLIIDADYSNWNFIVPKGFDRYELELYEWKGQWNVLLEKTASKLDMWDYQEEKEAVIDDESFETREDALNSISNVVGKRFVDRFIGDDGSVNVNALYNPETDEVMEEPKTVGNYNNTTADTRHYALKAKELGHDGVIFKNIFDQGGERENDMLQEDDVYIAFRPEQIKLIDNKQPTDVADIRFAIANENSAAEYTMDNPDEFAEYETLTSEDIASSQRRLTLRDELRDFTESQIRRETRLTHERILDKKTVKDAMRNLIYTAMENTESTPQQKNENVAYAMDVATRVWDLAKSGKVGEVAGVVQTATREMVEDMVFVDDAMYRSYQDMRDYFRKTKIEVPGYAKADVNWPEFRKKNLGRMRLVNIGNKGVAIDKAWSEIKPLIVEFVSNEYDLDEITHPAEMLEAIDSALDNTKAYRDAYADYIADDLIRSLSKDIIKITATQGEAWHSFADTKKAQYDERTKQMKQRHAEAMRDMREAKNKRIEELKRINVEDRKAARAKLKETRERLDEEYRLKTAEQNAKRKESLTRKQTLEHINSNYKWLTDRLMTPSKDISKNIPEDLRGAIAEVLKVLNLQTERSKEQEAYREMLTRNPELAKSHKTIALQKLREKLQEVADEDQVAFLYNDTLDEALKIMQEVGGTLSSMNNEQLDTVDTILSSIKHMVQNENKMFSDRIQQTISDLGEKVINESKEKVRKYKRRSDWTGAIGWFNELFNENMMTPDAMFEGMGGAMETLYRNLRLGQDDYIRKVRYLSKRYEKILGRYYHKHRRGSEIDSWRNSKSKKEFTLESGEHISMTVGQIMSLRCLSKRDQAFDHMTIGGIVVEDTPDKSVIKDAIGRKRDYTSIAKRLTVGDIIAITSSLTDEQAKVADELQEIMNGPLQDWGNETSMKLFGIKLFKEENYFPIQVEQTSISKEVGEGEVGVNKTGRGQRITSFGFTKNVKPNANNKLVISDIFDVAAEHSNKMALYSAYACPLADFKRVMNYKEQIVTEDGSVFRGESTTAQLQHAYGSKAITFINHFLQDINGQEEIRKDAVSRAYQKAINNYKKQAIGVNLRVLVQQPTAIARAFYVINPKYLLKPENPSRLLEEMHEHCPIAWWKAEGNYQNDFTRSMTDIMFNRNWSVMDNLTMKAYGVADDVTWAMLWHATKNEVSDKHKDVEYGSDRYWELCNERASEIFDKTQVVDSVFHRSDIMRSNNPITKLTTSFMAEPTKTYNMLRTSAVKASRLAKEGDKAGASKEIIKITTVLVANAVAVSAAAALIDALRGRGGDDEKDEGFSELWWKNMIDNFRDNMLIVPNNIPYLKDISQMFVALKNGDYYSQTNMATDGFYKLFKGIFQDLPKVMDGEKTWDDLLTGDFARGLSALTGVPMYNTYRDVKSIFKKLGISTFASDGTDKSTVSIWDYGENPFNVRDGSWGDKVLNHFGLNLTPEEKAERNYQRQLNAIKAKVDRHSGDRKSYINELCMDGYTKSIESGDLDDIKLRRKMIKDLGGDVDAFDKKVSSKISSEYKKTIGNTDAKGRQTQYRMYLEKHGWTEQRISHDIVAKSDSAKDLKRAYRNLDEDGIVKFLTILKDAGMTKEDALYLYEKRHTGNRDTYSTGKYAMPCEGTRTSDFGHRSRPTAGASSYHEGIDIAAGAGSTIRASDGGKVIYAGYNGGYGYQVQIQHDNGDVTYYSHLNGYAVKKGSKVEKGEWIGDMGSTGTSTGPHLDFRIKHNGKFVNPDKYLGK